MKILAALLVICVVSGCAGNKHRVAAGEQRPPFSGEVLVFEKTVPDSVSYRVIGNFVSQKRFYGSTGQTSRAATKEAAAKGANGILIERTGVRVTALSWASPYTKGKLLWIENYEQAKQPYLKPEATTAKGSVDDRLDQLEVLRGKGKVTDKEYAERRAAILADL